MKISNIKIKGFKSFGNNTQSVDLDVDKGGLYLISGNNGAGKSSFISSFEWVVFGKTRGNSKKWSSNTSLPNRINNELLNEISFESKGINVNIKRGLSPNVLELSENNVINKSGKQGVEERILELVGMDVETFKSFISVSVNDFKNFINLNTDEKTILLDKLFNLEIITRLNGIMKELYSDNKKKLLVLESEINTINDTINKINKSIEKSIQKSIININDEIKNLSEINKSKKEEYEKLKENSIKIKEKYTYINNRLREDNKQNNKIENELFNIDSKIKLLDSKKCPTCESSFETNHFDNLKDSLISEKIKVSELKDIIDINIKDLEDKKSKLDKISDKNTKSLNNLTFLLKHNKEEITKLKSKLDDKEVDVSLFQKNVEDMTSSKEISVNNYNNYKSKEKYYKELNKILSVNGIRKNIINGLLKPINEYINNNIRQMKLPFEVTLNDDFDATIKSFGFDIEVDTLSTGERRRINVCILVAYLRLIRKNKFVNVLFIDEVFSSVDMEGIEDILVLLKDFADNYNINIFVVHHAIMNENIFDKIIKIEKNIFTNIEVFTNENSIITV